MKNPSLQSSIPNSNYNINYNNKSLNNFNNNDLSQSTLSYKKSKNRINEKYQINCNNNNNSKCYKSNSVKQLNSLNNETDEELSIIESLWDDLGVEVDYQEEFKNYIRSLNDEQEKTEIYLNEKNSLRKLREALIKLSVEITNRENNIFKLKKYNSVLEKYVIDKNDQVEQNIFDKIQNTIKFLRLNAVNVINQMGKIREIASYYELKGKWDPRRANRAYLYNSHYLLNMTNNIKFINNSILFNFIETDNGIKKTDLFFSNCKNIITDDNTKLSMPISIELKNAINKCKYIILQDTLLNNIKRDNMLIKQRHMFSPKTLKIKNNILPKCQSDICLLNESDAKKYITMFGHSKVNLSRTLYYLKKTMGNDYEKMFFNSNINRKKPKNLNIKRSLDIFDKHFHIIKKNINIINDDNNSMNNNKIIIEHSDIKGDDNIHNYTHKNSKIILEHINADNEDNKINNDKINKEKIDKEKVKRIRPNEKGDNKKRMRNQKKNKDINHLINEKEKQNIIISKNENEKESKIKEDDIVNINNNKNEKIEKNNENENNSNKNNEEFNENVYKNKFKENVLIDNHDLNNNNYNDSFIFDSS